MYRNQLKRIRSTINAMIIAALLAGLIPPPLFTHVADLTGFQNLSGLEPSTAAAAPLLQQATEPNTEILLSVNYDGTAPFSADDAVVDGNGAHTPGEDGTNGAIDSANNNVVRTYDLVGYRIDWNVTNLTPKMWSSPPPCPWTTSGGSRFHRAVRAAA